MEKNFIIVYNSKIAENIFEMVLQGDTSSFASPGQFVNIALDQYFLRRPFSVADYDEKSFTIVYKIVGEGTKKMSYLPVGEKLNCLTGLGNGFSIKNRQRPLLIAGGVGLPPLYKLAKVLKSEGQYVSMIAGFNKSSEIFWHEKISSVADNVIVATLDGSFGEKGLVTDVMNIQYDYIYACGPIPMLKAVDNIAESEAQYSLEERMGCGFGACMGCSIMTKYGPKRVCGDGPVFERGDLLW